MIPRVSLVVCCYNMRRELPRTLHSMSPAMQRGVNSTDQQYRLRDRAGGQRFQQAGGPR